MMDAQDRKSVLCFLALTFGISAILWVRSFGGAPLNSVVPFLMWTPLRYLALSALRARPERLPA